MNYLKSFIGWTHSYNFKIPCLHVESPEADYDVKRTEGRSLKTLMWTWVINKLSWIQHSELSSNVDCKIALKLLPWICLLMNGFARNLVVTTHALYTHTCDKLWAFPLENQERPLVTCSFPESCSRLWTCVHCVCYLLGTSFLPSCCIELSCNTMVSSSNHWVCVLISPSLMCHTWRGKIVVFLEQPCRGNRRLKTQKCVWLTEFIVWSPHNCKDYLWAVHGGDNTPEPRELWCPFV